MHLRENVVPLYQIYIQMLRYALLFSLFFINISLISAQDSCQITLSGKILDCTTEQPIDFVQLFIKENGKNATSDEQGNYQIQGLCEGKYTVICTHVGCEHIEEEIIVEADKNIKNFHLNNHIELHDIIVKDKISSPKSILSTSIINAKDFAAERGQGMAASLANVVGVNTLSVGATVGKPIIQGLHSDRVVIFNNEIRQEGHQWGSDHAPEVDMFLFDNLTVIRGAGAIRYAADALGGVVLNEPRALLAEKGWGGQANLLTATNSRMGVASLAIDGRLTDRFPLAMRLQGTLKRSGDFSAPDYTLTNTGVKEYNFSAAAAFHKEKYGVEAFYSQFNTDIGIFKGAHIHNLTDLQNAINATQPFYTGAFSYDILRPRQHIIHELFKLKTYYKVGKNGKISFRGARQFNRRQEFDAARPYGALPNWQTTPDMQLELTTYTGDLTYEHQAIRHFRGTMGINGMLQRSTTDRGALIPDFNHQNIGFYAIERWQKYPFPLIVEAGARWDIKRYQVAERPEKPFPKTDFQFSNPAFTLGAIYKIKDNWELKAYTGTAWRAPNISELFSYGVHHGTASFEIGDANLLPEKTINFSIVNEYKYKDKFATELTLYQQAITNFIYAKPDPANPTLTIRGAFPTFNYVQTNALMRGIDASATWLFLPRWKTVLQGSILRAKEPTTKDWLFGMPADRVKLKLFYTLKESKHTQNTEFHLTMTAVDKQYRAPINFDYAASPNGYILLGAGANTDVKFNETVLKIGISATNITNTRYRDYLNRFRYFADERGRDVSIWINYNF